MGMSRPYLYFSYGTISAFKYAERILLYFKAAFCTIIVFKTHNGRWLGVVHKVSGGSSTGAVELQHHQSNLNYSNYSINNVNCKKSKVFSYLLYFSFEHLPHKVFKKYCKYNLKNGSTGSASEF